MATRARWVLATTIGLMVAGFIFHFPGSYGELYRWDPTALIFGGLIGFVSGVGVGLIQWGALLLGRREGLRLLLWMGLGIGLTHALHDGSPNAFPLLAVASLSGLAMAAAYAWSLRERRPIPMIAVGVAWAAGLLLANATVGWMGLPWEETPVGWSTEHAIDGAVVGLVWGVATASAGVLDQLRRPQPLDGAPLAPIATDLA